MERLGPRVEVDCLEEELTNRSIRYNVGNDKIQWGYSQKGFFSLKEAYNILIRNNMDQEDET